MKDENVKDIPKGLCVRPWQQLGILPSGNTRFCCMSSRLIRNEIGAVSINDQDIDNIWNESSIRSVRKCMAEGEMPAECSGCYEAEKSTGESPRTRINEDFSNGFLNPNKESVMAFIERVTHHDGTSHELPVDLDLELSNTCNLSCRMCSPDYSSKIESDNIQNKWRPRTAAALKKESDSWQILPSRVSGIYYEGFDNQGTSDKGIFMSGGHWARVVFKTTKPIRRVEIGCNFDSRKISWKIHLKIGERHFATPLRSGRLSRIEIPVHADIGECRIAILAYPKLGVDPAFLRSAAARFQCHFLRVDFHDATNRRSGRINRSWAGKGAGQAIAFVKDCNEVRRLQLMGGEPLLLKETVDILDHMILSGKAKNITLSLVTNGTIWNGIFAEKLSHFKSAVITVSLDGVGNQYEYIRYGAIWSEVKKNIISMNSMSNTRVWLGPTIQAYNCYSLPELVDFAAKEGLLMRATWLRHPRYLSVVILPPAIKLEMLRQLKEYAAGIASRAIGSDHRYVTFVRRIKTELSEIIDEEADGKAIDELMLYTNDLDGSRSQNIRHACPQLVADLAREGFDWHSRRRHHGQIAHDWEPREPIRELWLKIWRRTRTFVA